MKVIDWIARTAMLVLAALATLALIGSLASVSNSPIGAAFPGLLAGQDVPSSERTPAPAEARDASAGAESPESVAATVTATVERTAASRDAEIARWLKALTYAVIALAAIAAAAVVALARIGGHLARIAER